MRTLRLPLLCLLAASACASPPPTVAPEPASPTVADTALSDRRVAYVMDVTLDPEAKTIAGTQRITWRNPDVVPVDTLQFHLYLNAFQDSLSTFMRESGGAHRGFRPGEDGWGGLEVEALRLAGGADLTGALRFVQTTDHNRDDRTVAEIVLPDAVAPGDSVVLEVHFTARMPRIFARTGWARASTGDPFFMVAQWFPKLGVREVPGQRYVPADAPRGRWSTHQFHQNTEFYADFGTYRVTMRVPESYVVGATGVRVGEDADEVDGVAYKALTYYAADVHDFAWTASPAFEVYEDAWEHVRLRLLVQPEHASQAARHFEAAKVALAHFARWVGPYPYTTLTLVDGIGGSNGMEYPTLITCGTVYGLPAWLRALELVTIHEFGHQYFYGMLASNEAEEAWLDEGINSYLEARIMDAAYGPGSLVDLPGLKVSGEAYHRLSYLASNPESGVVARPAYRQRGYAKLAYNKPATILLSLQRYLGEETMNEVLRTYYRRWRFRHPTTRDFIAVAEGVSGEDLSWFFEPYVYGLATVDYGIDRVEQEPGAATVVVARRGDGAFPMHLALTFADGTTRTETFRPTGDTTRVHVPHAAPLVTAQINPDGLPLDADPLDDGWRASPDRTLAYKMDVKWLAWTQQLLTLFAGF